MKIIVSGHGNFASGIMSALKLISGPSERIVGIDFSEDVSTDILEQLMEKEIDQKGTLFLCDLVGGSPYKTAAILSMKFQNTRVIGGVNLGMLIDVKFNKDVVENVDALVASCLQASKESVNTFELPNVVDSEGDEL